MILNASVNVVVFARPTPPPPRAHFCFTNRRFIIVEPTLSLPTLSLSIYIYIYTYIYICVILE